MSDAIDSGVLVAAMVDSEAFHAECDSLLDRGDLRIYTHAMAEVFSTLTGGRRPFRLPAAVVAELIEKDYAPALQWTSLDSSEILISFKEAQDRGVRGGAVFDYLHLVAARKAGAARLYTLNVAHLRAFHRPVDPEIARP